MPDEIDFVVPLQPGEYPPPRSTPPAPPPVASGVSDEAIASGVMRQLFRERDEARREAENAIFELAALRQAIARVTGQDEDHIDALQDFGRRHDEREKLLDRNAAGWHRALRERDELLAARERVKQVGLKWIDLHGRGVGAGEYCIAAANIFGLLYGIDIHDSAAGCSGHCMAGHTFDADCLKRSALAAVDTYETQTGGTE